MTRRTVFALAVAAGAFHAHANDRLLVQVPAGLDPSAAAPVRAPSP